MQGTSLNSSMETSFTQPSAWAQSSLEVPAAEEPEGEAVQDDDAAADLANRRDRLGPGAGAGRATGRLDTGRDTRRKSPAPTELIAVAPGRAARLSAPTTDPGLKFSNRVSRLPSGSRLASNA